MKNLLFILSFFVLFGCNNESPLLFQEKVNQQSDKAIELMCEFWYRTNPNSRSEAKPMVISVKDESITFKDYLNNKDIDSIAEIKGINFDTICTSISIIEFIVNGEKGFSIVSDDYRLNKVYAFCEKGSITDTISIPTLKLVIDDIQHLVQSDIIEYYNTSNYSRSNINEEILIDPIVKTQWGQGHPYNDKIPVCYTENHNHNMPLGCVSTAVAQAITKCKHYLGESRETLAMQFDFLTEVARIEAGTYRGEYVAPFTKEIAYGCKTKFGCNSSSATLKDAYNYLKWQGYNCSYANGEIDDNGLIDNLQKGYPHIIGGISNDNEFAHAWIIDGYSSKYRPISSRNQRLILEVLYHCNWGWDGNCDGWYACDDYPSSSSDPRNRTYISKKEHIYIYGF